MSDVGATSSIRPLFSSRSSHGRNTRASSASGQRSNEVQYREKRATGQRRDEYSRIGTFARPKDRLNASAPGASASKIATRGREELEGSVAK